MERPIWAGSRWVILLALVGGSACSALPGIGPAATPTPAATVIAPLAGWDLIWQDEFEGAAIDPANWTYDVGGSGWGNGEMQNYTARPENAHVADGQLVIEARLEKFEGSYYTSARLKSQGLQAFQYGRMEARLKVPSGAGLWPAFWMLGASFNGSNWPDCGEIDIMEYVGREPDLIMGTLHGPGYSGALGFTRWNRQTYDIADDFHTYAVEWDTDQIQWFFDGQPYHSVSRADVGERPWVLDQPFFFILNLAVGGTLGGMVQPETTFPAALYVDYVRAYQAARATP